jgi:L-lactate dehydrogenase complex protein LldG
MARHTRSSTRTAEKFSSDLESEGAMSMANGHDNTASREAILTRVREALRQPAPVPHFASHDAPSPTDATGHPSLTILPVEAARPWLPDGGDSPDASMRIFAENLEKLRAVFLRVENDAAAAACLAGLVREKDWKRVAWHANPLVEAAMADVPCERHRVDDAAASFDKNLLETCDAGVTSCECLVAQTGSLLVSSGTCGGRGLSILPHAHVVIATVDQLVPTLADALHAVRAGRSGRMPSMLSFITGPSRTGDIERILVLGAHGPKELFVILVG